MLGRVLFTVVCLVIGTGLLLPIYPAEVAAPGRADAQGMLIADSAASGCRDCTPAASEEGRCLAGCVCGHALLGATAPARACLRLTVYLIVRPLPVSGRPSEPQLLPPKLPTI
jgi:hypothetical protein